MFKVFIDMRIAVGHQYRHQFIYLSVAERGSLHCAFPVREPQLFRGLFAKPWVVYAKRPFAGPESVIDYLGRYTHKIAISNHRLLSVSKQRVRFRYKDYRDGSSHKVMDLEPWNSFAALPCTSCPKALCASGTTVFSSRRKAVSILQIILQLQGRVVALIRHIRSRAPEVLCPCCKKH